MDNNGSDQWNWILDKNKSLKIIKRKFNCTPPSCKKTAACASEMLVPIYQTAHGPYITTIIKIVHNLTIDFIVLVPQEQTKTVNVMHKYHGDIALSSPAMVFIVCST